MWHVAGSAKESEDRCRQTQNKLGGSSSIELSLLLGHSFGTIGYLFRACWSDPYKRRCLGNAGITNAPNLSSTYRRAYGMPL